jgi:uroporphyrinogen-III decarboxylase
LEKPRRLTCTLAIPMEVQCEYTGIGQDEYYNDLEKTIAVTDRFPALFEAATGYRPTLPYTVPVTAYEGVAALGGRLHFAHDHQVMVLNQGRVLTSPRQVDELAVPDPWQNERFQWHVARYHELARRFPGRVSTGLAGQEGPVTNAGLLRGPDFFADCHTDPDRAHHLLDVCTDMLIAWTRASDSVVGLQREVIGLADDYAGMIRPSMWPEFVLPYYQRIIDALGPKGCWMHTELVHREHLPYLAQLRLTGINFSEDVFITPQDVFAGMPGVPFGWHILTVAEMQQGTPELIRRRFHEIVAAGVDGVRTELTVDTPPANVRAFLAAATELGATPA